MKPKKLTAEELNYAFKVGDYMVIENYIAALEAKIAQGVIDYDRRTDQLNREVRARVKAEAALNEAKRKDGGK